MCILKNSLNQSHDIMRNIVREGDILVDATCGNGNDTVFLSGLAGDAGKVYSFDIQEQAIEKTRAKLNALNLSHRVVLVNDGHQNMDRYVKGAPKAVMFNLGYLPGGNHSIATKGETTVEALQKAMQLIVPNGIISLVVYYGGDSGFEERDCLLNFLPTIDCRKFTVMKTEFVNQVNCPPFLVCIEKICL